MKIISGKYKNKKLISLSENTKPTSSFVKEAVFNMLYEINGTVLDLFAGSGNYGFEALSRGAKIVYFNDVDKKAYKSLLINKKTLNLTDEVLLYNLDYLKCLKMLINKNKTFDFIFLDPPYNFTDEEILNILNLTSDISNKIILERDKNSNTIEISNKKIIKQKIYGIKQITIYE